MSILFRVTISKSADVLVLAESYDEAMDVSSKEIDDLWDYAEFSENIVVMQSSASHESADFIVQDGKLEEAVTFEGDDEEDE